MAQQQTCDACSTASLYDDPVSGDTICTQCGLVANRDGSLVVGCQNIDHMQNYMVSLNVVPSVVRRIVNQLDLEPSDQWIFEIVERNDKNTRLSVERVCEIILNDLTAPEQRGVLFDQKIEPLLTKHRQKSMLANVMAVTTAESFSRTTSVFDVLLKKLSAYVPELDRRSVVRMSKLCEDTVERHPTLHVVLPASVVIATYIKEFHIKETKSCCRKRIDSLCTILDIKACSVNKVLKTITSI